MYYVLNTIWIQYNMKGRSNMKNIGRILKCTAAVAVCALTFSGCNKYDKMMEETPLEYVNLAAENTTSAMVKSAFAEEAKIIEQAVMDGTMGLSFKYDTINVDTETYVNEKDKKASGTYIIEANGEEVEIYYAIDDTTVKFGEKGKTAGENVVEINAKTLVEDLAGSIFAPGSGSSMELPQEDYDMIVEYLGEVVAAVENNGEDLPEEYEELEELINEMMNDATVEKKVDTEVDGTEVKANIITFNFNKDDIKTILDAYVDVAVEEMIAQGEDVSREEITAELDEAMNAIEKIDIELVYYVNSKTHSLMQMDCKVDMSVSDDNESQAIGIECITSYGADPAESDEVTMDMTIEADDEKLKLGMVSERKSEDETEVTVDMSMQGVSMEVVVLNFKREDNEYTISAEIPVVEATATISGNFETTSDSVEVTVDKVSYAMASEGIDGNLEDFEIKGYIKQGGKFDDRDAKNLFKLSEDELMGIVEAIGTDFSALAGETEVGGAMLGYIDNSKITAANANAKTVYVAFASALTQMSIDGGSSYDYEFYNETSGITDVETSEGYVLNITEYLGDNYEGYYYVSVDMSNYAVEYALWSETPIDYYYQYGEFDQEMFAEEGNYIGCYPLANY